MINPKTFHKQIREFLISPLGFFRHHVRFQKYPSVFEDVSPDAPFLYSTLVCFGVAYAEYVRMYIYRRNPETEYQKILL